ncbi:MAG: F0F1 ATP synthase subunit delta [Verrucomicrobia bacterium]|nr:F0F1 ATP synthase subunit delta [Verrucomicrobiota bacterium]
MKIGKQARRDGKDLYRICLLDGVLNESRVRQVMTQVLASKPRNYLAALTHFQRLVELDIQSRTVRIDNAVPTSESQMDSIKASLTQKYGTGLDFQFFVDPTLIGGLRIQIGSDVFDGTVKTRLAALENSF